MLNVMRCAGFTVQVTVSGFMISGPSGYSLQDDGRVAAGDGTIVVDIERELNRSQLHGHLESAECVKFGQVPISVAVSRCQPVCVDDDDCAVDPIDGRFCAVGLIDRAHGHREDGPLTGLSHRSEGDPGHRAGAEHPVGAGEADSHDPRIARVGAEQPSSEEVASDQIPVGYSDACVVGDLKVDVGDVVASQQVDRHPHPATGNHLSLRCLDRHPVDGPRLWASEGWRRIGRADSAATNHPATCLAATCLAATCLAVTGDRWRVGLFAGRADYRPDCADCSDVGAGVR